MYRLSNDSPKNPSQRQDASSPRIPILGGDQQNQLLAGVFFPGKERTGQLKVHTLKPFIRLQTTLCTPVLLISHIFPYLSPTLAVFPPKTKLKQNKQKTFFTSVFLTLLVRGGGGCSVLHFSPISLTKSLIWFKASSFWYPVITGPHPSATPSHRDPACIVPQDRSLHKLQQVLDGVDVKSGPIQGPGCESGWFRELGPHLREGLSQVRGGACSPMRVRAVFLLHVQGWDRLSMAL